jgi:hypothetical protein
LHTLLGSCTVEDEPQEDNFQRNPRLRSKIMNPMLIANLMTTHKLTDVMVSAVLTGKDEEGYDQSVQAGPKQIKALTERGFVSEDYGTLTAKGQLVYRALTGEELSEDETNEILKSTGTTSSRSAGTFVVDVTAKTVAEMVRPSENGEGVSWADAKQSIRDHFLAEREFAREVLKSLPKLRKNEVTDGQPDSTDSDSEVLFSDESETVDA